MLDSLCTGIILNLGVSTESDVMFTIYFVGRPCMHVEINLIGNANSSLTFHWQYMNKKPTPTMTMIRNIATTTVGTTAATISLLRLTIDIAGKLILIITGGMIIIANYDLPSKLAFPASTITVLTLAVALTMKLQYDTASSRVSLTLIITT